MYYTKTNAQEFTIPGETNGVLYPSHPQGEQTVARVSLDGRYPEKGYSINETCTETLYILSGSLTLTYGEEQYVMEPEDIFYIVPGTKYALEGKGESLVLISPEWDSDQNTIIEAE